MTYVLGLLAFFGGSKLLKIKGKKHRFSRYPLVVPNIAIAGIAPDFWIGNTSSVKGSIFQPAMLVDPGVYINSPKKKRQLFFLRLAQLRKFCSKNCPPKWRSDSYPRRCHSIWWNSSPARYTCPSLKYSLFVPQDLRISVSQRCFLWWATSSKKLT